MNFGNLYYFLEYLNKNHFFEIESVNSKGPIRPKASALWPLRPTTPNGPKGLTGLATAARFGCHTT
jgi:hypothetical protein